MKTPRFIYADYLRNDNAKREHTFNQVGNKIKELPYMVISPARKPFLRKNGSVLAAECWNGSGKVFFSGLIPVSGYKNCFCSDWKNKGKDIIAFVKIKNGFRFFWWPNFKKYTKEQRIGFVQEFLSQNPEVVNQN